MVAELEVKLKPKSSCCFSTDDFQHRRPNLLCKWLRVIHLYANSLLHIIDCLSLPAAALCYFFFLAHVADSLYLWIARHPFIDPLKSIISLLLSKGCLALNKSFPEPKNYSNFNTLLHQRLRCFFFFTQFEDHPEEASVWWCCELIRNPTVWTRCPPRGLLPTDL